jgi:hypothetical protein
MDGVWVRERERKRESGGEGRERERKCPHTESYVCEGGVGRRWRKVGRV